MTEHEGVMTDLKPCPFCGGKAQVMLRPFIGAEGLGYVVECDLCWALTGYYDSAEKAAIAWNRRA